MTNEIRIIIIDDEDNIRKQIEDAVKSFLLKYRNAKYSPIFFSQKGSPILSLINENFNKINESDVALIDYNLANDHMNGLQIAEILFKKNKNLSIVFVSGQADFIDIRRKDTDNIIAYWIPKPISQETISNCFSSVIFKKETTEKISELNAQVELMTEQNLTNYQKTALRNGIVYSSKKMNSIIKTAIDISNTDAKVLITGANGTGKGGIARMIYSLSKRRRNVFIELNCAAIPSELIESELFGHEKGSFTSASQQRKGRFELANEGTLFLDEIGDMSLSAQAKVLHVLQENKITRVGGDSDIEVNVRVIAATNKNLESEISQGRFREDLFHRLNVIPINLPSLQERGYKDIKLLVKYILRKKCNDYSKWIEIEENALEMLTKYNYPGNVRELENIIERVILLSNSIITVENLKTHAPVVFMSKELNIEKKTNVINHGANSNFANKTFFDTLTPDEKYMLPKVEEELNFYEKIYNELLEKWALDITNQPPKLEDVSIQYRKNKKSSNYIRQRFTGTDRINIRRKNISKYLFSDKLSEFKIRNLPPFNKLE